MEELKTGIYRITCLENGRVYIGQAKNILSRWTEHKSKLNGNYHINNHLQNAWNKYGSDKFIFEVLEFCKYDELNEKEIKYILEAKNNGKIFNKTNGGDGCKGYTHTKEYKESMCGENNPMYKKVVSNETRQKISNALYGRKYSKERCENISKGRKGIVFTEEHIKNMSISRIGTKQSQETINKRIEHFKNGKHPNSVKVVQITLDGEFIKIHNSIRDAKRETGACNINKVCSGERKSACGFKWMYYNDYIKKYGEII